MTCQDHRMRNVYRAVALSLIVWALCLLGFVAAMTVEKVSGCPEFTPGTSDYGTAHWDWFPPGDTCTYAIVGDGAPGSGQHADDPPIARVGELALLVLWPLSTVFIARRVRQLQTRPDTTGTAG
jgi:hypothetical protein